MRILHLAPLWYPVSADAPGGRETFLAGLITALRRLDSHSTVLASGDSRVGRLIPVLPMNLFDLMQEGHAGEYGYYEDHQLWLALQHAAKFDVIHSHLSPGVYGLSALPGTGPRMLYTLHTSVWKDMEWLVGQHPELRLSTVSALQARKLWQHGPNTAPSYPTASMSHRSRFRPTERAWCSWGGSSTPRVRTWQFGWLMNWGGRSPSQSLGIRRFSIFRPRLSADIRYVGVVDHVQKNELLGHGACAILPFRGCEAFGMVTIEAMACGTPVVALANGALPEVVDEGITGYVTGDERDLAPLVLEAARLDRAMVRGRVAARFDLPVVAARYLALYRDIARHLP